jgi:hypothetical protein
MTRKHNGSNINIEDPWQSMAIQLVINISIMVFWANPRPVKCRGVGLYMIIP